MHVLLTGGYGCIGAWIIRQLLAKGARTTVYDLKQDPQRLRLIMPESEVAKVVFRQGDVTDLDNLKRAIADGVTHVVHLAGLQVPTCRADPLLGAKVNVLGTLAVFEAVKAHQPQVQRLVYASSAAVFGPQTDYGAGPLPDDVRLTPTTHYGFFKTCNEGNARVYYLDFGLSSIGLRPWTVYGVGRDFGMTSEPTKAIKALALGRPYHVTYGGWQDMQFVEDAAAVFVRALTAPYQGAKSYNLRGDLVEMPQLHKAMCEADPSAEALITYGTRQIGIAYDLDDEALQRDLGPIGKTPLVEGIKKTLEAFRQLHREGRLDTSDLDR
jgi:nucleoside-diphosphate-sugar epimerase